MNQVVGRERERESALSDRSTIKEPIWSGRELVTKCARRRGCMDGNDEWRTKDADLLLECANCDAIYDAKR